MALETATYIDTLNVANPPGGDPVSQADDHIRLIKQVLQATFPNISGPVMSNHKQLGYDFVPVGTIMFWYSTVASIPSGWGYCDGSTYAKLDGSGNITSPNLRDKWIVCTGTGWTAGMTDANPVHSHASTAAFTGTPFGIAQANLPNYYLTVGDPGHTHSCWVSDPGHVHGVPVTPVSASQYLSTFTGAIWGAGGYNTAAATTGITAGANGAYTGISVALGGSGVAITPAGSVAITPHADLGVPPYYSLPAMIKL